jgi:hypothetical protein
VRKSPSPTEQSAQSIKSQGYLAFSAQRRIISPDSHLPTHPITRALLVRPTGSCHSSSCACAAHSSTTRSSPFSLLPCARSSNSGSGCRRLSLVRLCVCRVCLFSRHHSSAITTSKQILTLTLLHITSPPITSPYLESSYVPPPSHPAAYSYLVS